MGSDRGLPTAAGDRTPAEERAWADGRPRRRCSDARRTSRSWLGSCAGLVVVSSRLVGPGGVGKTRLAIAAAMRLAADFADGARFVALASVFEPRELASAIARALAVPIRDGEPSDAAVSRFLADRHLLLVLDNFEQLVEAAAPVGDLLPACPGLTVMVTSREPTRLAAERLFLVRPLEVPDASVRPLPIELERYDAVATFVDRAQARDPEFALDDDNAPHVREICRRLDGLPLALELAAARVGLLPPAELATRLDHALAVLTSGARDIPDRQRTLRATIDWSHDLLTDTERQAFARIAAFPAGASLAAAELVTGASLDTLDSLVAKQLLVRRDDRLLMLETVREYAAERLAENADADATYERLASWCGDFAREATPHLVRADRAPWLAKLDREYPNALAALSWALDTGRAELALQLVGSLGDYWCEWPSVGRRSRLDRDGSRADTRRVRPGPSEALALQGKTDRHAARSSALPPGSARQSGSLSSVR